MLAPDESLTQRTYNVGAISFTPVELAASLRKELPAFEIAYAPDFRQEIAETWPQRLDDSAARQDWGWQHSFDLDAMTRDMLAALGPAAAERAALVRDGVLQAAERRKEMMEFLAGESAEPGDEAPRVSL